MSQIRISMRNEPQDLLETSLTREKVSKILGTVTYEQPFCFLDAKARPTGEIAVSLSDLCKKIRTVKIECLAFHLKRRDFQKWISEIIGDIELARRLNRINVKKSVLRGTLYAFVSSRIQELKEAWLILLVMQ